MRFLPGVVALVSLLPLLFMRGLQPTILMYFAVPAAAAAFLCARPTLRAQLLAQVGWWATAISAWLSVGMGPDWTGMAYAVCGAGVSLAAMMALPRLDVAREQQARMPIAFIGTLTVLPVGVGVMGWMLMAMGLASTVRWPGTAIVAGSGLLLLLAAVLIIELRTAGLLLAPVGPAVVLIAALVRHHRAEHVAFDLRFIATVPLLLVVLAMSPLALARTAWRPAISSRVRAGGRKLLVGLAIISSFVSAWL